MAGVDGTRPGEGGHTSPLVSAAKAGCRRLPRELALGTPSTGPSSRSASLGRLELGADGSVESMAPPAGEAGYSMRSPSWPLKSLDSGRAAGERIRLRSSPEDLVSDISGTFVRVGGRVRGGGVAWLAAPCDVLWLCDELAWLSRGGEARQPLLRPLRPARG
eukprot:gb/GFBE01051803.1/.p1 GENE.gb/GFBE01051803.1/~~gb/GFBE01051803.1/.p1  ORF type:complete len:162 (+),score=8.02 gb/GFBE01051803.1/:1-486(+)